ncbi:YtxH domain-containing protein [Alkalihalobacterium chitinilyticum]|uniref:YtxH domain-containing protein n=1 Tax=Alkalihalobacterium chitinilyticum TaxID=2980103 RepID=A0ABT5VDF3_9BACI|nr:YtxH domain-containing protein [Alkalihalobacterium chitinilyticum]MDE5413357.1 YtxH domain-containing protein [Alkalihalobacterium chitinilyticum]
MKHQKNFALGTVVGGVVGATAALLTAPKSGEELRKDIQNELAEGKNKTEEVTNEIKEKMSELSEIINDSSSNVSQTVKQKSEQVINEAMELLKNTDSPHKMNIDHLKEVVREIMKEEMNAGQDIKKVVEDEVKKIEQKLGEDVKDLKQTVKK